MEKVEQKRRQRSLFSGLRSRPIKPEKVEGSKPEKVEGKRRKPEKVERGKPKDMRKKNPQLPFDVLTKIFDLLSLEEITEFTNETYWRSRCKTFFGVTRPLSLKECKSYQSFLISVDIPSAGLYKLFKEAVDKSWRITYIMHDHIHKYFGEAMDLFFNSFTKYKGDHYEDDPDIQADWDSYKKTVENGCLLNFCTLASYQTSFVDAYCSKFMKLFKDQPACYISHDYDVDYEENFEDVEELVVAVLPILMKGSCIKKATDLIWDYHVCSKSIDEWAYANEDRIAQGDVLKARVLYKWLKDYIEVDIPGPFPMKADGSDWYKARENAKAQYWAFIINDDFSLDL